MQPITCWQPACYFGKCPDERGNSIRGSTIYSMPDNTWKELCEAIMRETDPQKLLALVEELNRTLDKREKDLKKERGAQPAFDSP